MEALAILAAEHRAIERMLVRLQAEIDGLRERGELDVEALERLLAFFERHVEEGHQDKEELVFLPRLAARAGGADAALAARALEEHGAERARLAAMRGELEGAAYGDAGSLALVGAQAREYVRHQREHSRWEQEVLFALARRVLGAADERALVAGFAALDTARPGLLESADQLERWLERRHAPAAA
jgi:hemerythrin-like domain-containing protein